MRRKKKTCRYEALEAISTVELDEQLQAELQKDAPDEKVVLPILQVLREREEHCRETVSGSSPAKTVGIQNWFGKAAVAVAIVGVLIMAIPNTVGAESIFNIIIRWTESAFAFLTHGEEPETPQVEYVFQTDNPGLQQLHNTVVERGITEPVVPMWLPEGYELVELKVTRLLSGSKVFARFEGQGNKIDFTYRTVDYFLVNYEKKDSGVEVYEKAETEFYILENKDNYAITWLSQSAECFINTDVEKNVIYKVIDSIYRGEIL